MQQVIAVLDIGKTNKKVVLFDTSLQMVETRKRKIEPYEADGIRVEDVEQIEEWFLQQLTELAADYEIRAITIATHGAAAVCVGADGKPSVPPVDYTQPVDEGVRERFFAEMGSPAELQVATATAEVQPLINVGKSLFFLKERYPEGFAKTKHLLFYPQYFAYRLTGVATADVTYTGCHSYLWDFTKGDWSVVVDRLGIRDALPKRPILPTEVIGTVTDEVARRTGISPEVVVTAGIHDSNSSLIPYLITRDSDFVLNSTGTWCVAMHPTDSVSFAADEVGKMVFYNLSYVGKPVKTSILTGGLEYETYHRILSKRHGRTDEPEPDHDLFREIVDRAEAFILPSVIKGSGQFPDTEARTVEFPGPTITPLVDFADGASVPAALDDYERGLALVDLSVAIQTVVALRRVGLVAGTDLFIEGGFRNNRGYLAFLSALLPDNPIFLTSVEEATSFGAALCGKSALEGRPVAELADAVDITLQPIEPAHLPGIDAYYQRFLDLLAT
ncbi:MAG: FGGY family carbohydrate kinase [Spirochaeta sp.]|nr:FGGY family carbohydrate kinase [Spirochaeta sp.]